LHEANLWAGSASYEEDGAGLSKTVGPSTRIMVRDVKHRQGNFRNPTQMVNPKSFVVSKLVRWH